MPVNVAQGVESFILAYLGEGDAKKALIYGGSTLLATFAGDLGMGWFKGADAEKFATEPIVAGALSALGMYAFNKKEKSGGVIKPFARGLAYTGASAGVNIVLAGNYIGNTVPVPIGGKNVDVTINNYELLREVAKAKGKDAGFFESNSLN